jgi:hypothetical protein
MGRDITRHGHSPASISRFTQVNDYPHDGLPKLVQVSLMFPFFFPWKPNARPELQLEAGATQERTLEAVSSRPWLGDVRLRGFSAHFVTTYQLF